MTKEDIEKNLSVGKMVSIDCPSLSLRPIYYVKVTDYQYDFTGSHECEVQLKLEGSGLRTYSLNRDNIMDIISFEEYEKGLSPLKEKLMELMDSIDD